MCSSFSFALVLRIGKYKGGIVDISGEKRYTGWVKIWELLYRNVIFLLLCSRNFYTNKKG